MNDQEQFIKQIEQLIQAAQSDPEAKLALIQYVALGVQAAQKQKAQQQSQQPQMAKCGAKLKRKEDGGIVADKCGSKMKKKALGGKADCNCKKHLARLGGKLVTVDCNGNIIK